MDQFHGFFFLLFNVFSNIFSATENSSWRIVYEVFKAGSGSAQKKQMDRVKKMFCGSTALVDCRSRPPETGSGSPSHFWRVQYYRKCFNIVSNLFLNFLIYYRVQKISYFTYVIKACYKLECSVWMQSDHCLDRNSQWKVKESRKHWVLRCMVVDVKRFFFKL